jgi:gephyrin
MADTKLKVALLIVSTTAARDPSTDATGAILREVLEQEEARRWELVDTQIVPDDALQIQRQVMTWADAAVEHTMNLILTTGGTGFAVADHTPEVGDHPMQ